jgi:hypothetical protein
MYDKPPLIVNSKENFKEFDSECHGSILMDDFDMKNHTFI